VTREDCGGAGFVGRSAWWRHRAGPGGFADLPDVLSLPAVYGTYTDGPEVAEGVGACAGADRWGWALRDLDADGADDLIVTRDDCADPPVGRDRWVVHAGTP
jgi:hypothetical protein